MLKTKKLLLLSLIILSITFLTNLFVYADENQGQLSPIATNSMLGEKLDILSLQSGSPYALVNGNIIKLEATVTLTDKKMLVPAKFISDTLGGKYEWNPKSKLITIQKDTFLIVYQLNNLTVFVNGKKAVLDSAPVLIKNVVLVPLKITVEALGLKCEWNDKLKTSVIKIISKTIGFPDFFLDMSIRTQIKKPKGVILLSDVLSLASLDLSDPKIANLNGLQYLSGLTRLTISKTNISDLTPLSNLINLKYLNLQDNKIKDVTPLKNLTNLTFLDLTDNLISDISVLTSLSKLNTILLWDSSSLSQISQIDQVANNIIALVIKPGMNDLEKELVLHDYLVTHIKYDKVNYDNHTLTDADHEAYGGFINKSAVCDGYAKAMEILLNKCGIECRVIYGDIIGPKDPGYEDFGHAWNLVKINGSYYHLDLTFDDPINIENNTLSSKDILIHKYFNISDKQMSLNHTWNRKDYPVCTTDNTSFNLTLQQNRDTIITDSFIYEIFNDNLYKFNPDGSGILKLSEDHLKNISLSNDTIFYTNIDDNNKIYRMKTDGTEKTKINDEFSLFPAVLGDYLYYIVKDTSTFTKSKLDGTNKTSIIPNTYTSYFIINQDWIYYRSFAWASNSKLYKSSLDFSQKYTITDEPLVGFDLTENDHSLMINFGSFEQITKDFLYFISKGNGNKIYKIKSDGTEKTQLNDTDSTELECSGDYLYYVNTTDKKYYRVKTDGKSVAELVG